LKVRSTFNTLVGAVCGGLPPMIGWVGATGSIDTGAWWLGAVLFVWQLPHFLALAWLYRQDYERGGFVMLPSLDRTGSLSARVVILTSLALLPLTLLGVLLGIGGWLYAAAATALGLWLLERGARLYRDRSDARARSVFLASITYLPLLLLLLVVDRGPIAQPTPTTILAADTPATHDAPPAIP
ncbi:MAG: UbiA family prenyltransferase, partial [Planctomycetota bacterium]